MEKYEIKVAQEFSKALGGRYARLGAYSGENFYNKILLDRYENAVADGEKLYVYLDGAGPYGSSFLDQSFGELARKKGLEAVLINIVFKTENLQWVVDYLMKNIWVKR